MQWVRIPWDTLIIDRHDIDAVPVRTDRALHLSRRVRVGGNLRNPRLRVSTPTRRPLTRSSAPSTAVGPTHFEGVIEKKIGEPAGLNCSEEPDGPCDLNFNVTAIQQGAPCGATDGRPGTDEQFLRFDIEAFSK